jgi:hypothetical protein
MRLHATALGLLGLAAASFGCGRDTSAPVREKTAAFEAPMEEAPLQARRMAAPAAPDKEAARPAPAAVEPGQAAPAARKLIRTGRIVLEVPSFARASDEVARIAARHGGYVADAHSSRGDRGKERGTLTIRVAADRFEAAMQALKALGRLRSEGVSTQDVTKAYMDLETRLRVKRETAERLREILRTRTGKLSDVLEAEREVSRVTEEIEQLEGERRYYDQQIALSTIAVELLEPAAAISGGALQPIRDALAAALEVASQSVGTMIVALAAGLPWALGLWVLWKLVRLVRRRGAKPPRA